MRLIGLAVVLTVSLSLAPLAAQAQVAGKVWRVGILVTANPRVYDSFVDELRRSGYVDGQNLSLEFRNAEGNPERLPTLAAELVQAGVDVILAAGGEAPLRAARQATTTTPIVIVAIDCDPLVLGYVASLARPGGNITGMVLQQPEVTAKRIELLKAMLPRLMRLAILWEASAADQLKSADAASRSLSAFNRSKSEIPPMISAARSRQLVESTPTPSSSSPLRSFIASARRSRSLR